MSDARADSHLQTVCLVILSTVAIGATLMWLQSVFVPFVIAVFLALMLDPIIRLLNFRLRVPRTMALVLTLLVGYILIAILGGLIATSVGQLAARSNEYQQQIVEMIRDAGEKLPLERMGIDPDTEFDPMVIVPEGSMKGVLGSLTNTTLGLLSNGLIVSLFLIFLLIGGREPARPAGGVWREVEYRVQRYIITKVVMSAATGALTFLILSLLGVRFAISFGAFAFFLNFIPNIGSLVSTLLPLPVVLLKPDVGAMDVFLAIALPGAVQFTIGNLIEPRVMGSRLDLHPVVVLLSLVFWGTIWGFEGLFLAVPMTASIKIAFERNPTMAPVADLLAGRLNRFFGEI